MARSPHVGGAEAGSGVQCDRSMAKAWSAMRCGRRVVDMKEWLSGVASGNEV